MSVKPEFNAACTNMHLTYALTYETPGKFRYSRIFRGNHSSLIFLIELIPTLCFCPLLLTPGIPDDFSGNTKGSYFSVGLASVLLGLGVGGRGELTCRSFLLLKTKQALDSLKIR